LFICSDRTRTASLRSEAWCFFDLPHAQVALHSIGFNWPGGKQNPENESWKQRDVQRGEYRTKDQNARYVGYDLQLFMFVFLVTFKFHPISLLVLWH
jgi:hypothetical protein